MNKRYLILAGAGSLVLLLVLGLLVLPMSCRTTGDNKGSGETAVEKPPEKGQEKILPKEEEKRAEDADSAGPEDKTDKAAKKKRPVSKGPRKKDLGSRLEDFRSVKDAPRALKTLEEADKLSLEERILKAALMLSEGKLKEARKELEALEGRAPKSPAVLYNKALLEHAEGKNQERDALLDRALKLDPAYLDALLLRGTLDLSAKHYSKANRSFQTILKKEPENFLALSGAGSALMNLDQLDKAVKLLDKAIALEPDYAYLYVDRARAWRGLKRYGKAEEDYTRAIELEPDVEWHYLDRARIRIRYFHDLEGAWEDLNTLEKINGNNFFAHIFQAGILDEWKRYDEAEKYYDRILAERPNYGFAHEPLAKIAYMHRDFKKAKEHFLKAYDFQQNDMLHVLAAALCMERLKDRKGAVSLLKEAAPKVKRDSLEYEMFRYYLEPGSNFFVTNRINKEENKDLQGRMYFYLGARDDLKGLRKSALACYENVQNTTFYEAELAHWEIDHP